MIDRLLIFADLSLSGMIGGFFGIVAALYQNQFGDGEFNLRVVIALFVLGFASAFLLDSFIGSIRGREGLLAVAGLCARPLLAGILRVGPTAVRKILNL